MSAEAKDARHWPFSEETGAGAPVTSFREALARKQARTAAAAKASTQAHMRHDRLIVGGRAHKKQHGLS